MADITVRMTTETIIPAEKDDQLSTVRFMLRSVAISFGLRLVLGALLCFAAMRTPPQTESPPGSAPTTGAAVTPSPVETIAPTLPDTAYPPQDKR